MLCNHNRRWQEGILQKEWWAALLCSFHWISTEEYEWVNEWVKYFIFIQHHYIQRLWIFLLISSINFQHLSREQVNLLVLWHNYLVRRLLISCKLASICSECKDIHGVLYIPCQVALLGRSLLRVWQRGLWLHCRTSDARGPLVCKTFYIRKIPCTVIHSCHMWRN